MSLRRHLRIMSDSGNSGRGSVGPIIKVAFATTNRKHVNQHFGSSEAFAIYTVGSQGSTLLEIIQFGEALQDGHEDKLTAKLALLQGCAAVYCIAVGGSAIRQLLAMGVQPVRVEDGALIDPVLRELETESKQGSPVRFGKAVQRRQPMSADRFQRMETEGWQE